MKLWIYLCEKYGYPIAISIYEAQLFGVPYPLRTGWAIRHHDNTITTDQAIQLLKHLRPKAQQSEYNKKAIRFIEHYLEIAELNASEPNYDYNTATSIIDMDRLAKLHIHSIASENGPLPCT